MEVVQAIVLKVFNFSDNQKIVQCFFQRAGIYFFDFSFLLFFRKRNCTVHLMQVVKEIFTQKIEFV